MPGLIYQLVLTAVVEDVKLASSITHCPGDAASGFDSRELRIEVFYTVT